MARTVKVGTWGSSWTSIATLAVKVMARREWIWIGHHQEHGLRGPAKTAQVAKADR